MDKEKGERGNKTYGIGLYCGLSLHHQRRGPKPDVYEGQKQGTVGQKASDQSAHVICLELVNLPARTSTQRGRAVPSKLYGFGGTA